LRSVPGWSVALTLVAATAAAAADAALPSMATAGGVPLRGAVIGLCAALTALIGATLVLRSRSRRLASFLQDRSGPLPESVDPALAPLLDVVAASRADSLSQKEHSQSELRDARIRLRVVEAERDHVASVLNALRDAVVVVNEFDDLVMTNEAAGHALGFDSSSAVHKPASSVLPDQGLLRAIRDYRDGGASGATRHIEHAVQDASGRERAYDLALSSVQRASGESGVVAILHDLTRERELSEMKTDFVAKASHELRTPLSSIRAYIEMLVDGEAQDEASRREFYGIIQKETDRLGRLIDNMLNISRIEAGIIQIDRTNVDFKSTIVRAIETIAPQAQEKQITLHTRLSDLDLCVEGDADMLFQVTLNLLSNAVKYTPDGGRVTVAADSDNLTRSVVVSVADTGLGIPPDSIGRVFEKFFRVENYKRFAKGTGLGLNLCRHIVETVHHGQIEVESRLGMGSKFTFTIPMRYAGTKNAA